MSEIPNTLSRSSANLALTPSMLLQISEIFLSAQPISLPTTRSHLFPIYVF